MKRRATLRYSNWFMWAFGVALVFFVFQVMGLQLIGIRLWTWITLLGIVVVALLTLYYFVRQYPADLAVHAARQEKRAYLRKGSQRPGNEDVRATRPRPVAEFRGAAARWRDARWSDKFHLSRYANPPRTIHRGRGPESE